MQVAVEIEWGLPTTMLPFFLIQGGLVAKMTTDPECVQRVLTGLVRGAGTGRGQGWGPQTLISSISKVTLMCQEALRIPCPPCRDETQHLMCPRCPWL